MTSAFSETPVERVQESEIDAIDLSCPTFIVWGSNTDVGKTLVTTGTCIANLTSAQAMASSSASLYLKPVQTGFPKDSDARFVYQQSLKLLNRNNGKSSISLQYLAPSSSENAQTFISPSQDSNSPSPLSATLISKVLRTWQEPVSPHLAVQSEGRPVSDDTLLHEIQKCLWEEANLFLKSPHELPAVKRLQLVETAGGVASPAPSGTLQCQLYRRLRLPGILVGDGRLGGISGTISAYDSLSIGGFDVPAVVMIDGGLKNEDVVRQHVDGKVFVLPRLPHPTESDPNPDLTAWFQEAMDTFCKLSNFLHTYHQENLDELAKMAAMATKTLWWPFTQHDLVKLENVTTIDSRLGHNFRIFKPPRTESEALVSPPSTVHMVDASASWWTQGPNAALQSKLAKSIGYSAARYGHVMYPQNVHKPALNCAQHLLEGPGHGWAHRVFFSDNGSTAVEVAIKMAFRKFLSEREMDESDDVARQLRVVALKGSYHGDTLGAMEAQAPSAYTGFLQQPWYRGMGLFLDPPKVAMKDGKWTVQVPPSYLSIPGAELSHPKLEFQSRDSIFGSQRNDSELASLYTQNIARQLDLPSDMDGISGALIIEPVIHGAGGMEMIDPLYQRLLVRECRLRNIPVIFDEVFVGIWRLGVESSSTLLGCFPDISCYAKLMTGGTVPLAATLATESVFSSFLSDSKLMALLHGHSYSAHPIGCSAAVTSMEGYKDTSINPNYDPTTKTMLDLWDPLIVDQISRFNSLERVVAIGSIFAVELRDESPGYASMAANKIVHGLRSHGVFCRPLGNVIYFMCGPMTEQRECEKLLKVLIGLLTNDTREN